MLAAFRFVNDLLIPSRRAKEKKFQLLDFVQILKNKNKTNLNSQKLYHFPIYFSKNHTTKKINWKIVINLKLLFLRFRNHQNYLHRILFPSQHFDFLHFPWINHPLKKKRRRTK